jgi:hypothetical protein
LFSHKAQLAGDLFEQADDALLQRLAEVLAEDSTLKPSAPQLAWALFSQAASWPRAAPRWQSWNRNWRNS